MRRIVREKAVQAAYAYLIQCKGLEKGDGKAEEKAGRAGVGTDSSPLVSKAVEETDSVDKAAPMEEGGGGGRGEGGGGECGE